MAIVKYPEYSVEIVVQEGTGEISNATFSATLDPMSTNNMVTLKKKNTNLKPFIWGLSKWGDNDYNYLPNTYKGISTIGSGKNAVITLTFSQPVDHFTLYFDEVAQSMPLSVTVGDKTFSNDDYQFTYSQETTQTTFTITVNEINTINGAEMPLMITGIENRIALDITHRTGLRKLRAGHTYTKDKGKPAYGIISQEGALDIFDFYTEVDDLIEMGLIDNKMDIAVKFQDNVVGRYTSDTWTEQQTGLFSVSLNDTLMEWQNIIVPKKYDLEFDKTAKDLYNHLKSMTDLEFVLDTTTDNHLQAIQIKYYYWEESTLWDFTQKLCDLGQLYIYMRNDGKIVVISQHRINELKNINASNPIIIPYSRIDGQPQINRLETNKINSVSVNENIVSGGEDLFGITKSIVLLEDTGNYEMRQIEDDTNYYAESIYNEVYNSSQNPYNGNTAIINRTTTSGSSSITRTYYKTSLVFNLDSNIFSNIEQIGINCSFTVKGTNRAYESDGSSFTYSPYKTNNVEILIPYTNTSEYSSGTLIENKTISNNIFSFDLLLFKEFTIHSGTWAVPYFYPLSAIIQLYGQVYKIETVNKSNNGDYLISSNEFFTTETKIDGVKVAEYNANQILSNFTGKQTISFRMATDTLYYKNGTNAYDINLGQTLQEFDLIQLKKTDGTYDPKIWQISKVEHEVGGSNWLNIEAVEI